MTDSDNARLRATIERERRQEEALRCDFEEELKTAQDRITELEAQPSASDEMRRTARELRENANGDCGAVAQAIFWDKKAAALETQAAQPSAQFVAGKLEGLRRAAEICKEQSQKFLEKAGWVRDSDGNFYRVLSAHNTESNAFVSKSNGAGCIRAAILAEAALKGEGK